MSEYAKNQVFRTLRGMMTPRGLPVTHETPKKNLIGILNDGEITGDYGIFFSVGHLKKPVFVTGAGYIIHGYIPRSHVNEYTIGPDMIYTGYLDIADHDFDWDYDPKSDDEYDVMWNETRGNLFGALISTNYEEWPKKQWERIIDNRTFQEVSINPAIRELRLCIQGVLREGTYRLGEDDFWYEPEARAAASDIMKVLQRYRGRELDTGALYDWPYPVDPESYDEEDSTHFQVETEIVPAKFGPDHLGWNIEGAAIEGTNLISVTIQVDPDADLSGQWKEIEIDLTSSTLAHEIHHLTQAGPLRRPNCPIHPPPSDSGRLFDYFSKMCEIPAFVLGFRGEARMRGEPTEVLMRQYLKSYSDIGELSGEEVERIVSSWLGHRF